jgi:hypothetical protein
MVQLQLIAALNQLLFRSTDTTLPLTTPETSDSNQQTFLPQFSPARAAACPFRKRYPEIDLDYRGAAALVVGRLFG